MLQIRLTRPFKSIQLKYLLIAILTKYSVLQYTRIVSIKMYYAYIINFNLYYFYLYCPQICTWSIITYQVVTHLLGLTTLLPVRLKVKRKPANTYTTELMIMKLETSNSTATERLGKLYFEEFILAKVIYNVTGRYRFK